MICIVWFSYLIFWIKNFLARYARSIAVYLPIRNPESNMSVRLYQLQLHFGFDIILVSFQSALKLV